MSEAIGTAIPPPHSTAARKKHVDLPASLPSVLAGLKADCVQSSKLLQTYQALQAQFAEEGVTQQSQLLLRKIALKFLARGEVAGEQAVAEMAMVAKMLMMNDLEIVGWSIYLTRMSGDSVPLNLHLTFSGVAAKYYFDDGIQAIQAYLEKTIPNFSHSYNVWFKAHKDCMRISPKELNVRFKELSEVEIESEPRVMQDYNFLVEEILQFNPTHTPQDPIRFTPIVLSHTKPDPVPEKPPADVPQEDETLAMDDLKLMRNASSGSMSDFQGWAAPGLERLSSIGDICPGFYEKGPSNWGDKAK